MFLFCFVLSQHGLISTADGDYFLEPVQDFTQSDSSEGHPHVIYKREAESSETKDRDCGVTGKNSFNIGYTTLAGCEPPAEFTKLFLT